MIADDLIYQLQRLMANLKASEAQYYGMKPFCFAVKDSSGNPTDYTVQQDSQEYLGNFISKLEEKLAKTSRRYLV